MINEKFLCDIYGEADLLFEGVAVELVRTEGARTQVLEETYQENKFYWAAENAGRVCLKESLDNAGELPDIDTYTVIVTEVKTGVKKYVAVVAEAALVREFEFSARKDRS